jgi:hypothetical protein
MKNVYISQKTLTPNFSNTEPHFQRKQTSAIVTKLLDNKHNLIDKAKRFNKIKL